MVDSKGVSIQQRLFYAFRFLGFAFIVQLYEHFCVVFFLFGYMISNIPTLYKWFADRSSSTQM